jgi:hypothetical protein
VRTSWAFLRECSTDQVVAVLGRVAVLAFDAGFSGAEVKRAVSDVQLQIAALREPLMVN